MRKVYIFVTRSMFKAEEELDAYIAPEYTDDGERIDSLFMKEVGLSSYEPSCIEAVYTDSIVVLTELLAGCSYEECWLSKLESNDYFNAALVIHSPNEVQNPDNASIEFLECIEF